MARTDRPSALLPAARVALRVLGIVVGAYGASAALVAAGVALLIVTGVDKRDAFTVCSILGFAVYVALALWAVAVQRLSVLFGTFGLITAAGAALGALPALLGGA